MTNLQLLGTLLGSPRRFFDELERQPRFALPLWLLLLTTVGLLLWYYAVVDVRWLLEQTFDANPRTAALSEDERERALRMMSPGVLMGISAAGAVLVLLVLRLLEALWYRFAGAATGVRRSFRQWFALANWTALPGVLGSVPAALMLALGDAGQIGVGALQPLSVNELLLHRPPGSPGYSLWSSIGPLNLLTLALAIHGVHCWSRRSWLYASLLVLLPLVLVGVPWAISSSRAA